jgi:hypothetical protein
MPPLEEDYLERLLAAWPAPSAPGRVKRRVFGRPWLRTIQVPVPIGVLALVALVVLAWLSLRPHRPPPPTPARTETLSGFEVVRELKPRIIRHAN